MDKREDYGVLCICFVLHAKAVKVPIFTLM